MIQTLSVRANGEIYVGGTASNGSGMILSKLTSNGDLLWSKSYANYGRIYGMYEQADQSLTLVANNLVNNYYVLTLLNVDGVGAVNWSKQLTLDLPASEIYVRSSYQDAQKNLYITGYHYNKTSYTGDWPFLLKTNNLGTVLWAKSYDEHFGTGKSIKEHPSLGIVWAGEHIKAYGNATQPDAWLVQTGTDGYSDCFQTIGTLSQNVALVPLTKFYTRMSSYITATPMPSTSPLIVYSVDKCTQNSLEITEHTTFQFINSNASLIFKIEDEELFVRVTEALIQGSEWNTSTTWFDNMVKWDFNLTYLWPYNTKDKTVLSFRPRYVASTNIFTTMDKFTFGFDSRFVSKIEKIDKALELIVVNSDIRVPSFITDFRSSYDLTDYNLPLRLNFQVLNIFNYVYVELIANVAPMRQFVFSIEGSL